VQLDLHATSSWGMFIGAFGSTLHSRSGVGPDFELEFYLGQRFDLSPAWSTTLTVVNYSYLHDPAPSSDDYQEISASVAYLDRWSVSVSYAPNLVRYGRTGRLGRYPAYVMDATGQLPVLGPLFLTAGIGYYALTCPGGTGYAYGNGGLAYEHGPLRVDAGYYFTEGHARQLFPYELSRNRFAASLSWHF
jgi:hypothetical protein